MTARLQPGVHQVEASGGSILLDERRGAYYQLNETATRMLALLFQGSPETVIVEKLVRVYDAEPHELARDLGELVRLCDPWS
ncbi:MAG: PqqD family peptide modification chaperone [Egibacteraceae bacterium]